MIRMLLKSVCWKENKGYWIEIALANLSYLLE